jgi:hypothetical protein
MIIKNILKAVAFCVIFPYAAFCMEPEKPENFSQTVINSINSVENLQKAQSILNEVQKNYSQGIFSINLGYAYIINKYEGVSLSLLAEERNGKCEWLDSLSKKQGINLGEDGYEISEDTITGFTKNVSTESHLEPFLLNQVFKYIEQHPNTRKDIHGIYIHTFLSPCDGCNSAIENFATNFKVPVFVTYNTGYYQKVGGIQKFHKNSLQHMGANSVFNIIKEFFPIGGKSEKNNRYILIYNP